MNESTARAELFDLQTSPSSFFLWEVPQKPVAVRIPYPLIDRLERDAVESFRSVTSKGSEVGGILIGSVAPGNPLVLSVADYRLIDCEYTRGPLYRLSDADLLHFQRAVEQGLASGAGIAGFFRTHTRKGISLDADDLALMEAHFRDPHQIALLVRPFATKASTAAIFIREDGRISGDASYLEFPFRSPADDHKATGDTPAIKTAPVAPAAPQVPQAAKPAARAQIVPIASRREISLPPLTEEKLPDVPHTTAASAPVALPPAKVDEPPAPRIEPGVEARIETKTADLPPAEREIERAVKPALAAAAASVPFVEPAPKSTKGLKLVLAALAAITLFVLFFVYPGLLRQSSKAPAATQADGSPLQLRVERTNGDILVTWNRDAEAIRNATKAVLTINDGDQHENVAMDLAQLRNGSIVYSNPQTADISFKMEVTGADANKTTSESVRVLRTRPSPLQDQTASANPAVNPSQPAPVNPAAAAPAADAPPDPSAQPDAPKPVVPTRSFNAQSLSARLRPAQPADMPEAPTVGRTGIASAAIPGVNLNSVAAAPVAPAPLPAPPPAAPKATPKAGGQIQQAVLISKKDPEYPKLARQTGAKGAVRLSATVGKDGRVKSVRVISGHPMLQAAAVEAVKQWVYRPTLLNGQPVETETEIVLNFVGDR